MSAGDEHVVLLDEHGAAIGSMPKAQVHGPDTPLHLGFSCYAFDPGGRLLLTRRASAKTSFGGIWTNTVCGHPAPGEDPERAVHRRAEHELGLVLRDVVLALPDFRYRAEQDGLVENEVCPVFLARTDGEPLLHPDEVDGARRLTWEDFLGELAADPASWSPWCREQVPALAEHALLGAYARAER